MTPDRPPTHDRRRCGCREDGHGKLRRPGFFPGGSSSDILRCRYSAVFRRRSTGTGVSSGYFWSRTKRELRSDPQPGASVPLRSAGKGEPTSGRALFSRAVQRSAIKSSAGTIVYWTCFRRRWVRKKKSILRIAVVGGGYAQELCRYRFCRRWIVIASTVQAWPTCIPCFGFRRLGAVPSRPSKPAAEPPMPSLANRCRPCI